MSEVNEFSHPAPAETLVKQSKFRDAARKLLHVRQRTGSETPTGNQDISENTENNAEHQVWMDDEEGKLGVLSSISDRAKRIGGALVLTTILAGGGGRMIGLGVGEAEAGQRSQQKRGMAAEVQHSSRSERMSPETEILLREADEYINRLNKYNEAKKRGASKQELAKLKYEEHLAGIKNVTEEVRTALAPVGRFWEAEARGEKGKPLTDEEHQRYMKVQRDLIEQSDKRLQEREQRLQKMRGKIGKDEYEQMAQELHEDKEYNERSRKSYKESLELHEYNKKVGGFINELNKLTDAQKRGASKEEIERIKSEARIAGDKISGEKKEEQQQQPAKTQGNKQIAQQQSHQENAAGSQVEYASKYDTQNFWHDIYALNQ